MRHGLSALWGVKLREEAQGLVIHPLATGEGKSGRVNDVNLCMKPRKTEPWRWKVFWGLGPAAGMRQCWLTSARQPGEHHGPGVEEAPGTGRDSDVWNVGTLSRSGRNDRLPVGSSAELRGGNRTAQEANGGSRKATGKRVRMAGPSGHGRARITGRIPRPGAWARKGADVSRVAL
jgi:hypothetical protein